MGVQGQATHDKGFFSLLEEKLYTSDLILRQTYLVSSISSKIRIGNGAERIAILRESYEN